MVTDNKLPSVQATPVSPVTIKPVRKAPPPPESVKTPVTLVKNNAQQLNSSDQNAFRSGEQLSNGVDHRKNGEGNTKLPPKPLLKPKPFKKSVSSDGFHHPPVDHKASDFPVGARVPPKPPTRDSSLINDVADSVKRFSLNEESDSATKPVPKKRTKSVIQ